MSSPKEMKLVFFLDAIEHVSRYTIVITITLVHVHVACTLCNTITLTCWKCVYVSIYRIARMVRQPRGNALLVGVGGTGKQSLTRLAAHMNSYKCFQIELTRGYNYDSFHEDLMKLYQMTGVEGQDTVFLFTDTQV